MRGFLGILGIGLATISVLAFEVRVLDKETGNLLAGALVISQQSTNKTDASGKALAAGPKILVHKPGYVPITMSSENNFEVKLPPAETISGRVIDGSSNPVSNAAITIIVPTRLIGPRFAVDAFPVISDSNGVWRCDYLPKNPAYVKLEFSHPDFDWFEQDFDVPTLRAGKATLKVFPVGTLSGRVLDPGGAPVSGAQVVLGDETSIYSPRAEMRTDKDGEFAFRRLRPERRVLGVLAKGWPPTLQALGTNFSPVDVRLEQGKPLQVRVQDFSGNPIPGVTVSIAEIEGPKGTRWGYPDLEWKTDAQGVILWSNAPTGHLTWNFRKNGYMARSHFGLPAAEREAVIKLGPAFSLEGTVVDANTGKPVPEFVVNRRYVQPHPSASPGTWYDWGRKTFRGGKFSLYYEDPLLGGSSQMHDWQFRIDADGYESAISRVIKDEERGTNIDFRLTPRAVPQFTLEKPSGKTRVTAAAAVQPANAAPGDTVTVSIKARVAEGHWIYALEKSGSANLPTSIESASPRALEADGPWRGPAPKVHDDGSRALAGDLLFQRRYLVKYDAQPKNYKMPLKLTFQVCNDAVCFPPETIDMETEVEIVDRR